MTDGHPAGRGTGLVLISIVAVQLGAAVAKQIVAITGPIGTVFYRVAFAALLLLAVSRPRLQGRTAADWQAIAAFGLALTGMNVCYYAALQHLPIGVTVTFEFTGPLAVALLGSHRRIDAAWALLAAVGLVLLTPIAGTHLDVTGVALALAAGAFWAAYILLGPTVGRRVDGLGGLALGLAVGAAVLAVPAVLTAGSTLLQPKVIGIGIVVAVLASVVPYGCELEALRTLTPARFGMLMSLEPAFAALAGAVVLSEHLRVQQLLAIAFVLVANAGAVMTARRVPAAVPVA